MNKEKRKEYEKKKRKETRALKRVNNMDLSESNTGRKKRNQKVKYIG
jgi:hypothetical protein